MEILNKHQIVILMEVDVEIVQMKSERKNENSLEYL